MRSSLSTPPTRPRLANATATHSDGGMIDPRLFAAGYAACFGGALDFVAKRT
jgi:organic hydroperoxide reductase OsmC/OhrA